MRHRTLLLLLLLLLLFLPKLKTHPAGQGNKVALKDGTRQNRAQKLPNVPSETSFYTTGCTMRHRTFLLLLLLLLLFLSEAENAPCRTGKKHSGPEGRNGARNEPKNCLTSLLKP